jgi:hypothetical protein
MSGGAPSGAVVCPNETLHVQSEALVKTENTPRSIVVLIRPFPGGEIEKIIYRSQSSLGRAIGIRPEMVSYAFQLTCDESRTQVNQSKCCNIRR